MSTVTSSPENYIYLDYAATAPLCEEAAAALAPYVQAGTGACFMDANANTLYTPGRRAFAALEDARAQVAAGIGARADEVVFTSCASEADTAAILGLAHAAEARGHLFAKHRTPQIIISDLEHEAICRPAERLAREGFRVDRLPVDRGGHVSADALVRLMTDDCVLVSVQAANGEIGVVQPVAALAQVAHARGALFHTDATQALGKMPFDLRTLGVDAASFSGHKIGAPKGVGFLYLRARTPFEPLVQGGGQEAGRRSGTQNVAGAVACAAAVSAAVAHEHEESARLRRLRDTIYAQACAHPRVHATVSVPPASTDYVPHVVNLHVDGVESSTLVLRFNNEGMCVSGGSACASGSLDPSHALLALGIDRDAALGELRVSMGRYTTNAEVDAFLRALPRVIGDGYGR